MSEPRTYHLAAPDRTGWFLGLDAAQVAITMAGLLGASFLATRGAYATAVGVVLAGLAMTFTRVGGQPLHQVGVPWAVFTVRRITGRHRWFAPITTTPSQDPEVPRALGRLSVTVVPAGPLARLAGDPEVAVVSERKSQQVALTLRVSGGGFALADPADQDRFCNGWGDALAACANSASHPSAVIVTVRATPHAGLAGATRRELFITVVCPRRHRRGHPGGLVAEAARLAERLTAGGLSVDGVLDGAGWATLIRQGIDPVGQASRAQTLGERAGVAHPVHAGPLAVEERWGAARVDTTWHKTFLVADWPRVGLPAAWLAGLMLSDGPAWTLSVWLEPVPAHRARQAVERQAAKLTSDEEQRRRAGFRIGAAHQRHHDDLQAREAELVSGHAEYEYVGIVDLAAATLDELDIDAGSLTATTAGCGVELRPLHGRHLAALASTLPLPGSLPRREKR